MPPRKSKKKNVKKVITNSTEDAVAKLLLNKIGMNEESEEGSEFSLTHRQDLTDDNIQDTSYISEKKEEEDQSSNNHKKKNLNLSGDNTGTKTPTTFEERKEELDSSGVFIDKE